MIRVFAAVATAIALTTGALGAQTRDRPIFLVGNMGYGWDQPHGGFSLNAGAGVRSQKLFAYLLPLDMTFVQGKQNRQYIMQTSLYGDQYCQDRNTGAYVRASNCRRPVSVEWGGAAEANFAPMGTSGSFFGGVGYRTGYASTVYGTIGYIGRAGGRTFGLARLSIGDGYALLAIGGHI